MEKYVKAENGKKKSNSFFFFGEKNFHLRNDDEKK